MIYNIRSFQVFGDGETLVILYEDEKEQYAFIVDNPLVRSIEVIQDTMDVLGMGGTLDRCVSGPPQVDINLTGGRFKYKAGTNLIFEMDFFRGKTVKQLLQVVHRKIDGR